MSWLRQWLSMLQAMLTPRHVVEARRAEQARRREEVRRNARGRL